MKRPQKKSRANTKKADFQPTFVALAISGVAVISLIAFIVIGSSMSL